jgi:hypothetical protein
MRRPNALIARAFTIETYTVTVMFWAALAIWRQVMTWLFFVDPRAAAPFELPFQVGLFVAFGVTYFLWMSLYVFGYVGTGTGAGFRLALLGLAARICSSVAVVSGGPASTDSPYAVIMRGTGPIWWARNLGVAAFGLGLALVVLASAVDLRRRRRGVRWMALGD